MPKNPIEIMNKAYKKAKERPIGDILSSLPPDCVKELKTIIDNAESQKGVLGVTLTSIIFKICNPAQDIRYHQEGMKGGYSGRTFDTNYITPFLKDKFPHYAMAESAWLTRSLEQPHIYDLKYPGKIRNKELKSAFLGILDRIQKGNNNKLPPKLLTAIIALLYESSKGDDALLLNIEVESGLHIAKIIEAVSEHIYHNYGKGTVGTARIPVLAIYSVYSLLMPDIKRYDKKILAPLQPHTSSDNRSKTFGDIDVNNEDGSCFESIEVKHLKPITVDIINTAFQKIKNTKIDRYYILTTKEPNNCYNKSVTKKLEEYKRIHSCQIIVNGVIPSLKYYLRLINNPQNFIDKYTELLEYEFNRGSGIKKIHLSVWHDICKNILNLK
jgi:DNA (cytosine-5)-methyltransferase 1